MLAGRPREAFRRRVVLPGCPLAFGRLAPSSLTRTGATHVLTVYHGLRREYREAAALWQDGLDRAGVAPRRLARGARPTSPRRRSLRVRAPAPAHDLLFIGDFNFRGGTQKSALAMIAAARAAGLSAAAAALPPLRPGRHRAARAGGAPPPGASRRAHPGPRRGGCAAATVIVTYPPIFAEAMDRFPAVAHDRLVVVVNQLAARDREGRDEAYDPLAGAGAPRRAPRRARGSGSPISERVRAAMAADPRYPPAFADTWTPLIDAGAPGAAARARLARRTRGRARCSAGTAATTR